MGAIASQITSLTIVYSTVKTSKLRVTGLCAGNSPGTGEFPAQMASYAKNVSIWWRHHAKSTHDDVITWKHFPHYSSWPIARNPPVSDGRPLQGTNNAEIFLIFIDFGLDELEIL